MKLNIKDCECIIKIDMLYLEDLINGARVKTFGDEKYIVYPDGTTSRLPNHLK